MDQKDTGQFSSFITSLTAFIEDAHGGLKMHFYEYFLLIVIQGLHPRSMKIILSTY